MNKSIKTLLLLSFLIQNSLSQSNETDFSETAYGYLKDFFVGMADDKNNCKCLKVVEENKQKIIGYLKSLFNSLSDIHNSFTEFGVNLLKIITIHNFAKNCKLLNFVIFYNKLTHMEEIQKLSNLIINSSREISGIFNKTRIDTPFFNKIGELAKKVLEVKIK